MPSGVYPRKPRALRAVQTNGGEKPRLPPLDPLAAQLEAGRNAIEGNRKLTIAVDALRIGLQIITQAEFDHQTKMPVTAIDLRRLAVETLDAYSEICGQNWRRMPILKTRAAGTGNRARTEREMRDRDDYDPTPGA